VGQPRYGLRVQDAERWAAVLRSPTAYVAAIVLGALWGSFANVCIYRWPPTDEHPRGRSVVAPGSHCFSCGKPVRWYDNVPLLSYLWLRGRCRDCGATFSARYLLVEAATAMLFGAAYHYVVGIVYRDAAVSEQLIRFGIYAAFSWVLVVITFIDLDHQLILDKITYPAIPIFYGLGLLLPGASWKSGLIGAAVGYGIVRLIADGYWLLTKREGMGYGDGKLLAIIGALFGWQGVFVSLFVGSLVGSVISIGLIALRVRHVDDELEGGELEGGEAPESDGTAQEEEGDGALRHMAVPFGPFLATGAVIYLFSESYLKVSFYLLWQ
jgi:leader peptidase (prepilin peptidase)/N-methyltransferase